MNECNNYTVYAGSAAELARAADRIDKSMDRAIGRNEIRYCLNNGRQVGYDWSESLPDDGRVERRYTLAGDERAGSP